MDENAIKSRIRTVFLSEQTAYNSNGRNVGGLGTFSVGIQQAFSNVSNKGRNNLVSDSPGQNLLHSRSADVLLKLYSQLSLREKEIFQTEIKRILLDKEGEFKHLTYLSYFVLYRIGDRIEPLKEALIVHDRDIVMPAAFGHGNLLGIFSHLLSNEYAELSNEDLDQLEGIINTLSYSMSTKEKIIEIKMRILESELEDVNPAINADRDKVISFWHEVFDSNEIEKQIQSIESLFSEGSFDETKLATCLGRVRVLLMDALKRLSKQLSDKTNVPALRDNAEDAEAINWFKSNKILGDNEKKLIRAIYNLSSTEGSHAAYSRKEYARIAKNVTYECLVMVIGLVPR